MPIEEPNPRFIRDQMSVSDIQGTSSKPLYRGVAKDILNARDIEGTAPRYERVSLYCFHFDIVETETLRSNGLFGC